MTLQYLGIRVTLKECEISTTEDIPGLQSVRESLVTKMVTGYSWCHFSSQEPLTATMDKTPRRIVEHGSETEVTSCTTETQTAAIERYEGRHHTDCIAPAPGQHSTTQRGVPWAYSSSSGKRARDDIPHPQHCGSFRGIWYTLVLLLEITKISRARPLGIQLPKTGRPSNH